MTEEGQRDGAEGWRAARKGGGWARGVLGGVLWVAALAGAGWWLWHAPRPADFAVRYAPTGATAVALARDLPEIWGEAVRHPVVAGLLSAAGSSAEEAALLVEDEETGAWTRMLAKGESLWAAGEFGGRPGLVAANWIGWRARLLRWELELFRPEGFERVETGIPGQAAWWVRGVELPPGVRLGLAFSDGLVAASLSANPADVVWVLEAGVSEAARLAAENEGYRTWAEGVGREAVEVPVRLWAGAGGHEWEGEVEAVDSRRLSASAETDWGAGLPGARGGGAGVTGGAAGAGYFGAAACVEAKVPKALAARALGIPGMEPRVLHALRMALEVGGETYTAALMEGEYGGRLTFGLMRTLGLSGLRVPTLAVATEAPDRMATQAAIGRVLDSCNARYRAAFVLHPRRTANGKEYCTLESAGRDEWVDELAPEDRPAFAFDGGFLIAASNGGALRKLLERGEGSWGAGWDGEGAAACARVDLARVARMARGLAGTWRLAQRFTGGGGGAETEAAIDMALAWAEVLAPLGEARATWGAGEEGKARWHTDLGLPGGAGRE